MRGRVGVGLGTRFRLGLGSELVPVFGLDKKTVMKAILSILATCRGEGLNEGILSLLAATTDSIP